MATTATNPPTKDSGLEVRDVVMSFSGVTVLKGVSVAVKPGEVIGLVGHNGAGKSTLMKVISGALKPVVGSVRVDGRDEPLGSPIDAINAGIATVYQELSLLPNLTVAENTFLGRELQKFGRLDKQAMRIATQELAERFGLDVDPDEKVGTYPVATRQLLEIAIATHRDAKYLLLDEPTTSLEGGQVDSFLEVVKQLAAQGIGIILVDHKLEELYAVAGRIIALVDGEVRIDAQVDKVSREEVVTAIAGHEAAENLINKRPLLKRMDSVDSSRGLHVKNLVTPDLRGVNLVAQEGRVLGIYGLVGSGRTELLRTLVGLHPILSGSISLSDSPFVPKNPGNAMKQGVVYVTEERKVDGIIPQLDSSVNTLLPVLFLARKWGWLNRKRMDRISADYMDRLKVKGDRTGPIATLSGGNQQKVLLARAIAQTPRVLLLDEPTKGVDLGVKADIHRIIRSLAHDENLTVIIVSSEEEEICDVADDVLIMSNGHTDGSKLDPTTLTPATLRQAAWALA